MRCRVRSIISHSGVANNDSHSALSQASPALPIEEFINRISDLMMQEVLEGISEPISENRVWVEGEEAVFDPVRILRFLNRFGGGAELLSTALGFLVSSTAVQWNTEHAGEQLEDDPYRVIEGK